MHDNIAQGYSEDVAFNNAIQRAALSHITESIGGDAIADVLTGEVGTELVTNTLDYITRSVANSFVSEAIEEGAEAIIEPIIDAKTLNTGMTVEDYYNQVLSIDTIYQMIIGGIGGAFMGGTQATSVSIQFNNDVRTLAETIKIETKKDYNSAVEASKGIDNILEKSRQRINEKKAKGIDTTRDENQLMNVLELNKAFKNKIKNYELNNPTMDAVLKQSDNVNVKLSNNAEKNVINNARPTMSSALADISNISKDIEIQSQKAVETFAETLQKDGININVADLNNLSSDAISELKVTYDYAKSMDRSNVSFANMVDKNGRIIDGLHDDKTGSIVINPNAKQGALSTLIHEMTHGVESSTYYGTLEKLVKEYYGDDFQNKLDEIIDDYSTVVNLTENGAKKELVARTTQNLLGNQDFVDRLVNYDSSLAYKMYEEIKYLNEQTNTVQDIEQNFMRAFNDNQTKSESNKQLKTQYSFKDISNNWSKKEANAVKAYCSSILRAEESNNSYTVVDSNYNYYVYKINNDTIEIRGRIDNETVNRIINEARKGSNDSNVALQTIRENYRNIDSSSFEQERSAIGNDPLVFGKTGQLWNGDRKGSHKQNWRTPLILEYSKSYKNGEDVFTINNKEFTESNIHDYLPEDVANEILLTKGGTKNVLSFYVDKYGKGTIEFENGKTKDFYINDDEANINYSISPQLIKDPKTVEEAKQVANYFNQKYVDTSERSLSAFAYKRENAINDFEVKLALDREIDAWTKGFETRDDYINSKNTIKSFTTLDEINSVREEIKKELADAFNNKSEQFNNLTKKAATLERILADKEIEINRENIKSIDITPVEETPITNVQTLLLNKLYSIQYKYDGGDLINVYAIDKTGDLLDTGSYTKEQLANKYGSYVTNEIIDNLGVEKRVFNNITNVNESIYDNKEFVNKVVKEAEKIHGITNNANEVGYIDLNGKMLDFSGKNDGAIGGMRNFDHRELSTIDGVAWYDFVKMGNIRMFPEGGGFELEVKPNAKQQKALLSFLENNTVARTEGSYVGISKSLGINKIGRRDVANLIFENKSPQQIMDEVMKYFSQGQVRFSIGEQPSTVRTNNAGEQITNKQNEYFANSKATVDNEVGNDIQLVYHTSNALFNEFDPAKDDNYRFGQDKVTYVSTNRDVSASYQHGNVSDADLNKLSDENISINKELRERPLKLRDELDSIEKDKLLWADDIVKKDYKKLKELVTNIDNEISDVMTNAKDVYDGSISKKDYSLLSQEFENLSSDVGNLKFTLEEYERCDFDAIHVLYNVMNYSENLLVRELNSKAFNQLYRGTYANELADYVNTFKKQWFEYNDQISKKHNEIDNALMVMYQKTGYGGYIYSGYANCEKPLIFGDNNGAYWNDLNDTEYWFYANELDLSEIEKVVNDVIIPKKANSNSSTYGSVPSMKSIAYDIVANVDKKQSRFLMDNPSILANVSNAVQDYVSNNYNDNEFSNYFNDNNYVNVSGKGDYTQLKFNSKHGLETNDIVKACLSINYYLKENGQDPAYDSVIFKGIYDSGGSGGNVKSDIIALIDQNNNQFKIKDDFYPTETSDIRYSISDNQGRELTNNQQEFFKDSKVRDDNGNLLVMYHGTSNAGFDEFDPTMKSFKHLGFGANPYNINATWFTTSLRDASSYGGNQDNIIYDPNEAKYKTNNYNRGNYDVNGLVFDSKDDYELFKSNNKNVDQYLDRFDAIKEFNKIEEELNNGTISQEEYDKQYNDIEEKSYQGEKLLDNYISFYSNRATEEITLREMIENKDNYDALDFYQAIEYGLNGPMSSISLDELGINEVDSWDGFKENLIENLVENGEQEDLDVPVYVRARLGEDYQTRTYNSNRTYETYLNITNPYIIDNNGDNVFPYKEVEDAINNNEYDGVIVKNTRGIGEYNDLSTIALVKNPNQIKLASNQSPTLSNDIRFSISDDQYVKYGEAQLKNAFQDKTRRINFTNEVQQALDDINTFGSIMDDTKQAIKEKALEGQKAKTYNDNYELAKGIRDILGSNFLKKDGWDTTIQELQDKYALFTEDELPNSYEDAKILVSDTLSNLGKKYEYKDVVDLGQVPQSEYQQDIDKKLDEVLSDFEKVVNTDKLKGANVKRTLDTYSKEQQMVDGFFDLYNDEDNLKNLYESIDDIENKALENVTIEDMKNTNKVADNSKPKYKDNTKEIINTIIRKTTNKGKAFWDLSRKVKNDSIYALYNNYRNATRMADYQMYKKGGLADIINEIPKNQQNNFSYYMYNLLNIDAAKIGKNVFEGISSEQSQKLATEYEASNKKFAEVRDKIYAYEKELRQLLVDNGRITQDIADKWEQMYPHYVHVVRNFDSIQEMIEEDNADPRFASTNKGAVNQRKGGNQQLKSLYDALSQQTRQVYKSISMNELAKQYAKDSNKKIEMPKDYKPIDERIKTIGEELFPATEENPATWIWYDNGETRSMTIPNEVYEALYTPEPSTNVFKDVASKVNDFRRNLITGMNPVFMVRNIIKDSQDVLYKSDHSVATYGQLINPKTWYELAKNTGLAEQWRTLGGGTGNFTVVHNGTPFYNKTIGLIERANNYVESLPRYAEFKASLLKGRTPVQAMYDSDRVTTNFKMGGEITKNMDRVGFTFLNASVEGFTEIIQSYETAYDKKGITGVIGKMAISTLLLNIPLMIVNHLRWKDDKDYQELSDYIKDNYYILYKKDNGSFVRIPKGRIAAAYQAVLNNLVDDINTFTSDEELAKKGAEWWNNKVDTLVTIWDNIGVNNPFTNNVLSPIVQVINNKTWYGEDLLSEYDLKKAPSEQYDYTTDKFSKWLGENINYSPTKINYLLEQYSGGIGDVVLPMLTPKAETGLDDGTVLGGVKSALASTWVDQFTTDPVFKNQNVSDLFTLDEELSQAASKDNATNEEKLASKYITSIKYKMFDLYGERADIYNDETLTDKEKYEKARAIQEQIVDIARQGLESYDNIDLSNNYGEVNGTGYFQQIDENGNVSWSKVDDDTLSEMNELNMTSEQRSTYYDLKEEITSTNKVNSLLNLYAKKEEINNEKWSDSIKQKRLDEVEEQISKAESKFTVDEIAQIKEKGSIDAKQINVDAIRNSNLTDEQKNYLYDNYYDSTKNEYINDLDIDDGTKLELKYNVSTAEGKKNANGKTVSNSKALAVADAYADAGVLDDIFEYVKANNLDPSDVGLSKTVFNYTYDQMANAYQSIFGEQFGNGETSQEEVNKINGSSYGTSGTSSTTKAKKLLKSYISSMKNNRSTVFDMLEDMDTVQTAKKKAQEVRKKVKG